MHLFHSRTGTARAASAKTSAGASSRICFQGKPVAVTGKFPQAGEQAPDFRLVNTELDDVGLADFGDHYKVLYIFVSADMPVCALSLHTFNEMATVVPNITVIGISSDPSFVQRRVRNTAGMDNLIMLSAFRAAHFSSSYGVAIADGQLKGLMARAVLVLDQNNQILFSQRLDEITEDPDYENILMALTTFR